VRFSVVIPTHQRCDLVARTVTALERQTYRDFEVVVAIDGSTDGTADELRRLRASFPLRVLEQPNRGAGVARNAGAGAARGDILLFLDDDMDANPMLLAEHERSHSTGAEIVLGHLPLDPRSPPSVLTPGVARWTERRRARLAAAGPNIPASDFITGQMSVSRENFERLGGFDVRFTQDGRFGGEDVDFGYRARKAGLRVVFNEAAITSQYYCVDPATYTRRSRDVGHSAQELSLKHPEAAAEFEAIGERQATGRRRHLFAFLATVPQAMSWPLRALAIRLVKRPDPGSLSRELFFNVQAIERMRGAREARRSFRHTEVAVLAYHSISDLRDDALLADYGVPQDLFTAQLDLLLSRGWRFVGVESVLEMLRSGRGLPRRAVLLTFDDAYADLGAAWPILANRGIPATVFAVSERIGGTNEWDTVRGGRELPLLDAPTLLRLAQQGLVVGSHGATHRRMVDLAPTELEHELKGSAATIASLGLPQPTVLAYPYGSWNAKIAEAVEEAGYAAAFTIQARLTRASDDRFSLPRIEVLASDSPARVLSKLVQAKRRHFIRIGR
jgi:GT2 family glycosyltransferase/peptidoglycan/xylan/chitin deacetylase (PgdA/CDA1 family)